MILDRLATLSTISFIKHAIPNESKTGKNCLFVRVDEGKLILTGGSEFCIKKGLLVAENTTSGTSKLPDNFMIPVAKLLAFETMLKKDKAECKKLEKNDASYMHVEITDKELVSYEGSVAYEQPKFQYKDLEGIFQINKSPVSDLSMMSSDIADALSGFMKSDPVTITTTGDGGLIHFEQGDLEAVVLQYVEKEKEKTGDQLEIDE